MSAMPWTRERVGVRTLESGDIGAALACVSASPVVNVFVDHRIRTTRLERRILGGEIWGYFRDESLVSMCHVGANLVLVNADEDAAIAFAKTTLTRRPHIATMVGPRMAVDFFWSAVQHDWWVPHDQRWDQPHLEIKADPEVDGDPLVGRTTSDQLDVLYPACVAMYREEVGTSPEVDGGRTLYRQRVAGLIDRGWSFSRIEDGKVLFKAEVACASPYAAQIQGVYVAPEFRNQGLATAGIAAVVREIRSNIAPVASLYLNAHNVAARTVYNRVGFQQTETFSTLMF
jgi:ribosomal protein S18 acetylase RimI-like enzyme